MRIDTFPGYLRIEDYLKSEDPKFLIANADWKLDSVVDPTQVPWSLMCPVPCAKDRDQLISQNPRLFNPVLGWRPVSERVHDEEKYTLYHASRVFHPVRYRRSTYGAVLRVSDSSVHAQVFTPGHYGHPEGPHNANTEVFFVRASAANATPRACSTCGVRANERALMYILNLHLCRPCFEKFCSEANTLFLIFEQDTQNS